jgi:hypothetical protein
VLEHEDRQSGRLHERDPDRRHPAHNLQEFGHSDQSAALEQDDVRLIRHFKHNQAYRSNDGHAPA